MNIHVITNHIQSKGCQNGAHSEFLSETSSLERRVELQQLERVVGELPLVDGIPATPLSPQIIELDVEINVLDAIVEDIRLPLHAVKYIIELSPTIYPPNQWVGGAIHMLRESEFEYLRAQDLLNNMHQQSADDHDLMTQVNQLWSWLKTNHTFAADEIIVRKMEGLIAFAVGLSRVRDVSGALGLVTSLFHCMHPGSALCTAHKLLSDTFLDIMRPEYEEQSSGLDWFIESLASLRENFTLFENLKQLPIFVKLHKFLMFALSHSMFTSFGLNFELFGFDDHQKEGVKRTHGNKFSFIQATFDLVLYVMEEIARFIKYGTAFGTPESVQSAWFLTVSDLRSKSKFLSNPEPLGFDIFTYRMDLDSAIERGELIAQMHKGTPVIGNKVAAMVAELRNLRMDDISKRSAQRNRSVPFGILLSGGSSLGKSSIMHVIFQHIGKVLGLNTAEEFKYTRNSAEAYWNGFTTAKWCIILDDIANQSPMLGIEDPTMKELIGIMNNVAYQPDQAALEDKGRTPVHAKLVIASTNTEHLNARAYFSCPLAPQRRLPWVIRTTVKRQHATNLMLDSTKIEQVNGRYPNYWDFEVCKVVPASVTPGNVDAKCEVYDHFDSIEALLAFLGRTAVEHHNNQDKVGKQMEMTQMIGACNECYHPVYNCVCNDEILVEQNHYINPFEDMCGNNCPCVSCARDYVTLPHSLKTERGGRCGHKIWRYCGCYDKFAYCCYQPVSKCKCENRVFIRHYDHPTACCSSTVGECRCDEGPLPEPLSEVASKRMEEMRDSSIQAMFLPWPHEQTERDKAKQKKKFLSKRKPQNLEQQSSSTRTISELPSVIKHPLRCGCALCVRGGFPLRWFERDYDGFWFPIPSPYQEQSSTELVVPGETFVTYGPGEWEWMSLYWQWTKEDSISAVYTLSILFTMWYTYLLTFFFGFFYVYFFAPFGKFAYVDWDITFCQFFVRRVIAPQLERRFRPIITGLKITTAIALSAAAAAAFLRACAPKKLSIEAVKEELMEPPVYVDFGEEQGANLCVNEVGTTLPPGQEKVNVWFNKEVRLSRGHVQPATVSFKDKPFDYFQDKVRNNCFRVKIRRTDCANVVSTAAVCVGGQLFAINTHSLRDFPSATIEDCSLEVFQMQAVKGVRMNCTVELLRKGQFYHCEDSDISFFLVRGLPTFANIAKFLPHSEMNGCFDGCYVGLSKECDRYDRALHNVEQTTLERPEGVRKYFAAISQHATYKGDCGVALCVDTPLGPIFGGLHALAAPERVFAAHMHIQQVNDAMKFFGLTVLISNGEIRFAMDGGLKREVGELHAKSSIRFVEQGEATVFGSTNEGRSSGKSKVVDTVIAPFAAQVGYTKKFGRPPLGHWQSAYNTSRDSCDMPKGFDTQRLDHCIEHYINDVDAKLPPGALDDCKVLSVFTAINGAPGVRFIDRIQVQTSAGAYDRVSKENFLVKTAPRDGVDEPLELNEVMLDRLQECHESYLKGCRTFPMFDSCEKDEAISFEKIKIKKVRRFAGAPMHWSIYVRMYFLYFTKIIQSNHFVFECAAGIVSQTREWHELFVYLTQYGNDRIVAGDFSSFDKRMPPAFILGAFKVLFHLAEKSGFSKEDILVMHGISYDVAFALVNMNGDLIMFYGSNPSGHPLTVIINSLVNSLYMRYCYSILSPTNSCADFSQNVALMTYGDDNIMGVSTNAEWFNHTTIAEVMKEIGQKYTMADKEADSVPFSSIWDMSFLKRGFRLDLDTNRVMSPLLEESIEKSIMVGPLSMSVSPKKQAADILSSANLEYYQWGKEKFEERQAVLKWIAAKAALGVNVTSSTFPTWDELVARFEG